MFSTLYTVYYILKRYKQLSVDSLKQTGHVTFKTDFVFIVREAISHEYRVSTESSATLSVAVDANVGALFKVIPSSLHELSEQ